MLPAPAPDRVRLLPPPPLSNCLAFVPSVHETTGPPPWTGLVSHPPRPAQCILYRFSNTSLHPPPAPPPPQRVAPHLVGNVFVDGLLAGLLQLAWGSVRGGKEGRQATKTAWATPHQRLAVLRVR